MNTGKINVIPMADFSSLPFEEQKKHFITVAKRALPLWGYPKDTSLKLLNITENATFLLRHPEYPSIVMRVHRLDYAEKNSIKTELTWILDLKKETSLHLATPLKSENGSYIRTIETPEMGEKRHVVCFSFEEGKAPMDSHDDTESIGKIADIAGKLPNCITIPVFKTAAVLYERINRHSSSSKKGNLTSDDLAMYRTLGRIAGMLHTHSKSWKVPKYYERIEWDWDATFGTGWNNFYGAHYRDIKILNETDLEAIDSCAFLMEKRLNAYGKSRDRYGMIHSDLRMANLLQHNQQITVLDFDDCGMGWYMYDIAGIVGFMEHRPDLDQIISEIVKGYREQAILTEEDELEIPTFIMMRRIGLLQAMMYHIGNTAAGSGESAEITPEIMAFYAKGTVVLAKKYIQSYKDLPLAEQTRKKEVNAYEL